MAHRLIRIRPNLVPLRLEQVLTGQIWRVLEKKASVEMLNSLENYLLTATLERTPLLPSEEYGWALLNLVVEIRKAKRGKEPAP